MSDVGAVIIKKKRGHGEHGHHGGSWKVAYADFVTAMMAFFMVMWIMGLSDETRAQIQGYFNDPLGFVKNEPRSNSVIHVPGMPYSKKVEKAGPGDTHFRQEQEDARQLQSQVQAALEGSGSGGATDVQELLKNVSITLTQEGLLIEFIENNGEVFFKLGSSEVQPAARHLISQVAPVLARSGRSMFIDGHTDARPLSGAYDNWDLSGARAAAVRRALIAGGVRANQLLGVRAYADTQPRKAEDPFHFSNRRVTVLLPFGADKPKHLVTPSDEMRATVQGVFRKPADVAPGRVDLSESQP
ncbi:MAG: Motility protein B [Fimbriimonadaceae bacterium]|nr:Motility protein B [Fimbriimonadaceae bacterium]